MKNTVTYTPTMAKWNIRLISNKSKATNKFKKKQNQKGQNTVGGRGWGREGGGIKVNRSNFIHFVTTIILQQGVHKNK